MNTIAPISSPANNTAKPEALPREIPECLRAITPERWWTLATLAPEIYWMAWDELSPSYAASDRGAVVVFDSLWCRVVYLTESPERGAVWAYVWRRTGDPSTRSDEPDEGESTLRAVWIGGVGTRRENEFEDFIAQQARMFPDQPARVEAATGGA